jgi:hypothetical protein
MTIKSKKLNEADNASAKQLLKLFPSGARVVSNGSIQ